MAKKKNKVERPTFDHVEQKTRQAGWLLEIVQMVESMIWGRWKYWSEIWQNGTIGEYSEWQIPQVPFVDENCMPELPLELHGKLLQRPGGDQLIEYLGSSHEAKKHVMDAFTAAIQIHQARLEDLISWLLWGLRCPMIEERPNIPEKAAVVMYHDLCLDKLIAHPTDWGAMIAREFAYTKGHAWFPTPVSLVKLMVDLQFSPGEDNRLESVNDCCMGTGVMLLLSSNHSLDLSGNDISSLMVKLTYLAAYMYMPWMIYPGKPAGIAEFQEEGTVPEKPEPSDKTTEKVLVQGSLF